MFSATDIRLGVAATLIAVCAGLITYLTLEKQLERQVVDFGRKGISVLADRVRDTLIDHPIHPFEALRSLLAAGDAPMEYYAGRFVEVQFYDKTSAVIAEKSFPDYQGLNEVKRFMAAQPYSFPEAGSLQTETMRIGGNPFRLSCHPCDRPARRCRGIWERHLRGFPGDDSGDASNDHP